MIETNTCYILTWQSPPRLPAHPRAMIGKSKSATIEDALRFFKNQAPDNIFISLEKVTTTHEDFSDIFIELGAK